MASSGKRKKSKKPTAQAARAVAKPKKAKKSAAPKKVKATPVKSAKRPKKKASKRTASSRLRSKASLPTVEQITPSGEPELVSNAPPVTL
jgi:hypothetical protein